MKHLMEKMDLVAKGLLNEAPKNNEAAKKEFDKHIAYASLWGKLLTRSIEDMKKVKDPDWADAGSAEKVANSIKDILEFLGKK